LSDFPFAKSGIFREKFSVKNSTENQLVGYIFFASFVCILKTIFNVKIPNSWIDPIGFHFSGVCLLQDPLRRVRRWQDRVGREGERDPLADGQRLVGGARAKRQGSYPGACSTKSSKKLLYKID
jgi:hypothetical protein